MALVTAQEVAVTYAAEKIDATSMPDPPGGADAPRQTAS